MFYLGFRLKVTVFTDPPRRSSWYSPGLCEWHAQRFLTTFKRFVSARIDRLKARSMVELALYPAVALIYFFAVLQATKADRVELPDSASVNVFCLFVLIQPLCLVIGGYTGMATYLISAIVSYNSLHWKNPTASPAENSGSAKNKKNTKKTN